MGRETYLVDLYRQSVQALTQNRTEWMGLLATKMGWEKQTGRYLKEDIRRIAKNGRAAGDPDERSRCRGKGRRGRVGAVEKQ